MLWRFCVTDRLCPHWTFWFPTFFFHYRKQRYAGSSRQARASRVRRTPGHCRTPRAPWTLWQTGACGTPGTEGVWRILWLSRKRWRSSKAAEDITRLTQIKSLMKKVAEAALYLDRHLWCMWKHFVVIHQTCCVLAPRESWLTSLGCLYLRLFIKEPDIQMFLVYIDDLGPKPCCHLGQPGSPKRIITWIKSQLQQLFLLYERIRMFGCSQLRLRIFKPSQEETVFKWFFMFTYLCFWAAHNHRWR